MNESQSYAHQYGFIGDLELNYKDTTLTTYFISTFKAMPLASVLDNKIFCIYTGLDENLSILETIDRFKLEHFCDDKLNNFLRTYPSDEITSYVNNVYEIALTKKFLRNTGFSFVIQAKLAMEGFMWYYNNLVLTIFSTPNYCFRMDNLAAIAEINGNALKIYTYGPTTAEILELKPKNIAYFL